MHILMWTVIGLFEVAILFLFDVDTVARRRMYGANQVIENQWGGDEDNDDDDDGGDDDDDDDDNFECSIFSGLMLICKFLGVKIYCMNVL